MYFRLFSNASMTMTVAILFVFNTEKWFRVFFLLFYVHSLVSDVVSYICEVPQRCWIQSILNVVTTSWRSDSGNHRNHIPFGGSNFTGKCISHGKKVKWKGLILNAFYHKTNSKPFTCILYTRAIFVGVLLNMHRTYHGWISVLYHSLSYFQFTFYFSLRKK